MSKRTALATWLRNLAAAALTLTLLLGFAAGQAAWATETAAGGMAATASSEWGPGYGADVANDGLADQNRNYWQTVEAKDKGAWWQVDLGEVVPVHGLKIAWARFEDKYHCPPARAVVQVCASGKAGSWKDVFAIGADKLPRDGAPCEPERTWDYPLPEPTPARYVRLFFPDGEQAGAKYPGYICLGEVEIQSPGPASQVVDLEGPFGKVAVNVTRPSLVRLYLRQPDGTLPAKSLLSSQASEFPTWAVGGVTHVRGSNNVQYSSRHSSSHTVGRGSSPTKLTISGIRPHGEDGSDLPALEDWTLCVEPDGGLRWTVTRNWESDFEAKFVGEPALFFNSRPNPVPTASGQRRRNPAGNGVMPSWWMRSDELIPESRPEYRSGSSVWFNPPYNGATMKQDEGWAIFKFYTSFPHLADLRCEAGGGHLYRRGSYNAFTEIGLTPRPGATLRFRKGEVVTTTLRLKAVPQSQSGQQLVAEIPDREMLTGLQSYFGGLANSGALCDQVNHYFGNQCDGFLYAGNMCMHAYSLLASVPAPEALSSAPVGYPDAFRKNLIVLLKSVSDRGEVMFGFRHPQKDFPELSLIAMIALEADLLYTGDVSVARAHRDAIGRMVRYADAWCVDELFYIPIENISAPEHCPNWYYDGVRAAGYILYHNLLLYRALGAMETVYSSLGEADAARAMQERRVRLRDAINRAFWRDDAYGPGHGGYFDWIRGRELKDPRAYFFSCMQYMAIVFGVADKRQSREILRTADHLIAGLRRDRGYTREGTLDNLLPILPEDAMGRPFGTYMNGGMLLAMTFWEVTARCHAGDAKGAHELLSRFAAHARRTNWFEGENAFAIDGRPLGWNNEPYLADQIVAAAALVHGFLGLSYSADDFQATPHLPPGWDKISAVIQFKGRRYRVTATSDGSWRREEVR